MLPELKVWNAAGSVLAQGNGVLCYEPAYQPGDVLELTVPQPGYYVICLDDAMGGTGTTIMIIPVFFPMLGPMWRQEANLYLQPGTPLMGSYPPPATDAIPSRAGGSIVTRRPAGCWTSGGSFRPIRWC